MMSGCRFLVALLLLLVLRQPKTACFASEASASSTPGQTHVRQVNGGSQVRSITLPHFEPELPAAEGRDAYLQVCVSCHSPRYVTMQPPFSQSQWEQETDKMAKTYGAQMDQEQRSAIISYLVNIHGPNSGNKEAAAADDDFGSTFASKASAQADMAPALALALDPDEQAQQVKRGAELFVQDCVACHGTGGAGDGWVGQVLLRRPKDLTAIRFSTELLGQVLWNGQRGTAMPSWRGLAQPDLAALAAYVKTLHGPGKPEQSTPDLVEHGKRVFQINCAPCHGVAGDGRGAVAGTLMPQPANFHLKQPDPQYILQVVSEGIPGTAMPSWKQQIPEADRQALAAFVRSLFVSD